MQFVKIHVLLCIQNCHFAKNRSIKCIGNKEIGTYSYWHRCQCCIHNDDVRPEWVRVCGAQCSG